MNNKEIVLSKYIKGKLNAEPKAHSDIEKFLSNIFGFQIITFEETNKVFTSKIYKYTNFIKKYFAMNKLAKVSELTIIQTPFTNVKSVLKKLKNKIIIIHDIEGLRNQKEKILDKELKLYDSCDYIIVHNQRMKDFLVERGISYQKIYIVELFDYFCIDNNEIKQIEFENPVIGITGNLNKAKFIGQLKQENMRFTLELYGARATNEFNNDKIIYEGAFKPEELPSKIKGNLGLVWDGNYDESDEYKSFKFYTKYNNPHKLSCYIAAGIPVIVWKKSAIADFVRKYNIGYEISNLYEINDIDFSDYEDKRKNTLDLREKVRNGYFIEHVISEIRNDIKNTK